jgi:hypothetical protein
MKIIAAIAREQDDVIERVLRHLHLWDPPWNRPRKARGPPPPSSHGAVLSRTDARRQWFEEEAVGAGVEDEAIDQVLDDDLYAVDPAPQEDDEPPA